MLAESPAAPFSFVPSAAETTTKGARRAGRPSAKEDAVGESLPHSIDAVHLAQLLTSRMCHDLSGAIGVTASADDLIGPGPELETDALALVAEAGRRAAARLAFFRAAFGFDRTSRGMTLSEVRALIEPALDRPRLRFEWDEEVRPTAIASAELSASAGRIILCLILIACEALPRGGTIRVKSAGASPESELAVEAEGPAARLSPEVLRALRAADSRDVTSSTVVGYYVRILAGRIAAAVVSDAGDGRVRLSLASVHAGGCRQH